MESSNTVYGIISNKYTVALISKDGTIAWYCTPLISSSPVFSSFVNEPGGGYFSIKPTESFTSSQHYIRSTLALETAFRTSTGTIIVTDFMPIHIDNEEIVNPEIIRIIRGCDGEVDIEIDFYPRFNYGKGWNKISTIPGGILVQNYDDIGILASSAGFSVHDGHALSTFTVRHGDELTLVFCYGIFSPSHRLAKAGDKLIHTVRYWRAWFIENSIPLPTSHHALREWVAQSCLIMKVFSHPQAGLLIEAPSVLFDREENNKHIYKDGRLSWAHTFLSAIQVYAELGYFYEAEVLMKKAETIIKQWHDNASYQAVFTADGQTHIPLIHLARTSMMIMQDPKECEQWYGYYNAALVIMSMSEYLLFKQRIPSEELWHYMKLILERLFSDWEKPDSDFWRKRQGKDQYVISKVLCWAAVDCMIKLGKCHETLGNVSGWEKQRDTMKTVIMEYGFNAKKKSFVQSFGSEMIDASVLLFPRLKFLNVHEEKAILTIEALEQELLTKEYAVRAWGGADIVEAYTMCSFWLAEWYAYAGQHDKAFSVLSRVFAKNESLGLIAEKIDLSTMQEQGFYPHIYSHVEFIRCVLTIIKMLKQ